LIPPVLSFAFDEESARPYIKEVVTLKNESNSIAEFKWTALEGVFSTHNMSGVIHPHGRYAAELRYRPDTTPHVEATAVLEVVGGPSRTLKLIGNTGRAKFSVSKKVVAFGLIPIGVPQVLDLKIKNQGPDAGIYGTRASVIGGCMSTSNVYAAKQFGITPKGTHAHSFVMSFDSEYEAFMKYAEMYPDKCLLLVDTYDVISSGIPNAIRVFDYLKSIGKKPIGVRIDSGDLAYLSRVAREMLDAAGHTGATVFASGDIDENVIESLNTQNAKIDAYGIGTKLITGYDNPSLGGVYKLSGIIEDGKVVPKMKISNSKEKLTNPGFKKIFRIYNSDGKAEADLVALKDEEIDETKPLTIFDPDYTWQKKTLTDYSVKCITEKVVENGKSIYDPPKIYDIRNYAINSLSEFYDAYKRLQNPHIYKVDLSDKLYALRKELIEKYSNA
jgi:nicotinate phosphoribosyltransferase